MKEERRETRPVDLRRKAEAIVAHGAGQSDVPALYDITRVLHELQVHQVELEMQNDELKSARIEVEQGLARYTELFDFAPIGYATMSATGVLLSINHTGAKLLGRPRSVVLGQPLGRFITSDSAGFFQAFLQRVLASEIREECEVQLARTSAEALHLRLSGCVLQGIRTTILLAFQDITDQKNKEMRLAQTEEELREAGRRKDEFLATLSHELRNPLAPIRNCIYLLSRVEPGSEKGRKALDIIDRQTEHLVRLVDDLLDVTRITRGKIQLRCEKVELCALVRAGVEDQQAMFESSGLTLQAELASSKLWLWADRARVAQILSNLLSNAEKFTPRGGTVKVIVAREGQRAVLRVCDTGVGIAPEVACHVFEPFAQAPQTIDRSRGGLGLGLATAKGLVELHGGTIEVASGGTGMGTCMVVSFLLEQEVVDTKETEASAPALRRVLVIDDSRDTAEGLRDALTLDGHEVEIASDGPTGLARVRSFRPNIVICDIALPGMDGYEVARSIREDPALRATFLVALTGYARQEDQARASDAGFDRHVAKPVSIEALYAVLAESSNVPGGAGA